MYYLPQGPAVVYKVCLVDIQIRRIRMFYLPTVFASSFPALNAASSDGFPYTERLVLW